MNVCTHGVDQGVSAKELAENLERYRRCQSVVNLGANYIRHWLSGLDEKERAKCRKVLSVMWRRSEAEKALSGVRNG